MDILLGILAGIGWASGVVATRIVMNRTKVPYDLGALISVTAAGLTGILLSIILQSDLDWISANTNKLIIVGLISPGLSQLTYFVAIKSIGPARAGVIIGVSPIAAVLGAYTFTDGVLNAPIVIGTLIVVLAATFLGTEDSGEDLKVLGIVMALTTGFLFGSRDVVSDELIGGQSLNSSFSAGVLWLAGVPIISLYMLLKKATSKVGKLSKVNTAEAFSFKSFRKKYLYIALPGVVQGLALCATLEAFKRGRVEVITPLANSVTSIGVVLISLVLIGRTEWSPRVGLSMGLIVFGAILVSGFG